MTLTVADTGVLVTEALARLGPDLARSIPAGLQVRVSAAATEAETAAVRLTAFAERVRETATAGLAAFVLLAGVAVARGRRAAVARLGMAIAVVCGLLAALTLTMPSVAFDDAAARAMLATWLELAAMAGGLLLLLAGASELLRLAGDPPARPLRRRPRRARRSPPRSTPRPSS